MLLILIINAGAFYYILLKGMTKGYAWQVSFLKLYSLSFLSDMLFVQTWKILWIDYMLPNLIYKDLPAVKRNVSTRLTREAAMEDIDEEIRFSTKKSF